VLHPPLSVDVLDPPAGILGNLPAAVRPESGVVVDRVVREVRGDEIDVPGIQRLVVGTDVVEVGDEEILTGRCRFGGFPFDVSVGGE
jgi:hypothetical protein